MPKTKTSAKPRKSETKSLKAHEPFKSDILKDNAIVTEALLDCIRSGHIESFRELLAAHLMTVNIT